MSFQINWGAGAPPGGAQEDDEPKAPQPKVSQDDLEESLTGMGANPETKSETFRKLETGQAKSVFSGDVTGRETVFKKVNQPIGGMRQNLPDPSLLQCIACGNKLTGKFVKIGAHGLHNDCFNCAVCGENLKGRGYFQKDGKLYCRKDRPL
ncbi:PDZ and LIM domain protein 4-like [Ptychodera flava]|uniref:PDZ and LIM domain protein 4-like n=1 Tax=Ptychodera flava TaxID=63121 RepID=UPI00396AA1E1